MPYIEPDDRVGLLWGDRDPATAGDLNFVISTEIAAYLDRQGLSYQSINNAIGVLECAKLELYRRIAVPYENKKLAQNGDVF